MDSSCLSPWPTDGVFVDNESDVDRKNVGNLVPKQKKLAQRMTRLKARKTKSSVTQAEQKAEHGGITTTSHDDAFPANNTAAEDSSGKQDPVADAQVQKVKKQNDSSRALRTSKDKSKEARKQASTRSNRQGTHDHGETGKPSAQESSVNTHTEVENESARIERTLALYNERYLKMGLGRRPRTNDEIVDNSGNILERKKGIEQVQKDNNTEQESHRLSEGIIERVRSEPEHTKQGGLAEPLGESVPLDPAGNKHRNEQSNVSNGKAELFSYSQQSSEAPKAIPATVYNIHTDTENSASPRRPNLTSRTQSEVRDLALRFFPLDRKFRRAARGELGSSSEEQSEESETERLDGNGQERSSAVRDGGGSHHTMQSGSGRSLQGGDKASSKSNALQTRHRKTSKRTKKLKKFYYDGEIIEDLRSKLRILLHQKNGFILECEKVEQKLRQENARDQQIISRLRLSHNYSLNAAIQHETVYLHNEIKNLKRIIDELKQHCGVLSDKIDEKDRKIANLYEELEKKEEEKCQLLIEIRAEKHLRGELRAELYQDLNRKLTEERENFTRELQNHLELTMKAQEEAEEATKLREAAEAEKRKAKQQLKQVILRSQQTIRDRERINKLVLALKEENDGLMHAQREHNRREIAQEAQFNGKLKAMELEKEQQQAEYERKLTQILDTNKKLEAQVLEERKRGDDMEELYQTTAAKYRAVSAKLVNEKEAEKSSVLQQRSDKVREIFHIALRSK